MKVVIDTNVLVSALLKPESLPAAILNLLLSGKIELAYDNRIIEEYYRVLRRKKFGFKGELIDAFMDFIKVEGKFELPMPIEAVFSDPDDKKFYEVFKTAKAVYLISGNKKHFPEEAGIISPAEFIKIYTT
jgi:putative PIN family toxin of toxin-antitoxin system